MSVSPPAFYIGSLRYAGKKIVEEKNTDSVVRKMFHRWILDDTNEQVWSTDALLYKASKSGQMQFDSLPKIVTGCFSIDSNRMISYYK
jgi:hypothetical protein